VSTAADGRGKMREKRFLESSNRGKLLNLLELAKIRTPAPMTAFH